MTTDFDLLTFDCYGTLIDWRRGISDAFSRIGAAVGQPVDRDRVLELHAIIEPEIQGEGFRPYRQVLDEMAPRIADQLGLRIPTGAANFLSESLGDWPPFPDTGPALERLRAAGYRLGILSNIDDDLLAATLKHLPVEFDLLVTAQQVGSYKPAEGHFVEARRRIGEASWLHVAQSFFHDVEPAVAMELPVVWINRLAEEPYSAARPLTVCRDMASFADWATGDHRLGGS